VDVGAGTGLAGVPVVAAGCCGTAMAVAAVVRAGVDVGAGTGLAGVPMVAARCGRTAMRLSPVVGTGVGADRARWLMAAVGGEGAATVLATGMGAGAGLGSAKTFMAAAGWGETTMGPAAMLVAMRCGEGRSGNRRCPDRGQYRDPSQQPAAAGAVGTGWLNHCILLMQQRRNSSRQARRGRGERWLHAKSGIKTQALR
jgi:hypothetical protein